MDQIEPTEDEKKNGWTAETLTRYLNTQASKPPSFRGCEDKQPVKVISAANYNPLEW